MTSQNFGSKSGAREILNVRVRRGFKSLCAQNCCTTLLETPAWRAMLCTDQRARPLGGAGDLREQTLHHALSEPGGAASARSIGQSHQPVLGRAPAPLRSLSDFPNPARFA